MLSTGASRQDNINVTIAIIGVVLLNATIGFFQEYRAEKATEALQKLVPANAKVVRDGEVTIVAAADLVPGDLIVLEEGDSISADARLVRQYELSTNNIALTGESDAVRKTADAIVEEELATINMPNLVFMGTSVASGTGRASRVRHRPQHRVRPHLLAHRRRRPTRSRRCMHEIDRMARTVSIIAIGLRRRCCSSWRWSSSTSAGSARLLFALGVMVALVPEGLPATLSVALAVGVQRMAKAKRSDQEALAGVETLGSTNVICTDKTGTLTKAEMTVKARLGRRRRRSRSPAPATRPMGDFVVGDTTLAKDEARRRLEPLLRAMTFCNDAKVLPPDGRRGLARDRRPDRGLPAGRRPEGRLRPAGGAHRAAQDLRAAVRVACASA